MNLATTNILNTIGLIFDISGAIFIFAFVPNFWSVNNNSLEITDDKVYERKKKFSNRGLLLIIIGFFFQLLSNIAIIFKF